MNELRATIQSFVDQHLPGQVVTYISLRWNLAAGETYLLCNVDDYNMLYALEEIDDETGSDLVALFQEVLKKHDVSL